MLRGLVDLQGAYRSLNTLFEQRCVPTKSRYDGHHIEIPILEHLDDVDRRPGDRRCVRTHARVARFRRATTDARDCTKCASRASTLPTRSPTHAVSDCVSVACGCTTFLMWRPTSVSIFAHGGSAKKIEVVRAYDHSVNRPGEASGGAHQTLQREPAVARGELLGRRSRYLAPHGSTASAQCRPHARPARRPDSKRSS